MEKRRVTARDILRDVRAGISDSELMDKYKLSAQGLQSVFHKMINAGLITELELEDRVPVNERTVDLGLFICPACGNIQGKEFTKCPRCDFEVPERGKDQLAKPTPRQESHPTRPKSNVIKLAKEPDLSITPVHDFSESVTNLEKIRNQLKGIVVAFVISYISALILIIVLFFFAGNNTPSSIVSTAVSLALPAIFLAFMLSTVFKYQSELLEIIVKLGSYGRKK
jgi:uncharacterized paraquat-inducible protein A